MATQALFLGRQPRENHDNDFKTAHGHTYNEEVDTERDESGRDSEAGKNVQHLDTGDNEYQHDDHAHEHSGVHGNSHTDDHSDGLVRHVHNHGQHVSTLSAWTTDTVTLNNVSALVDINVAKGDISQVVDPMAQDIIHEDSDGIVIEESDNNSDVQELLDREDDNADEQQFNHSMPTNIDGGSASACDSSLQDRFKAGAKQVSICDVTEAQAAQTLSLSRF